MGDLRYAVRMLAKSPGFTAVAVLTLALGIGANTATFSLTDALLLRPLLVPDLDRLVMVFGARLGQPRDTQNVAPLEIVEWGKNTTTLDAFAAFDWWSTNLTGGGGEPERVQGFRVSANLFDCMGVKAIAGRGFLPSEDEPGKDAVVVLSQGLWRRRFGADPKAIGATLQLNGRAYTVIGVMPADFLFPHSAELWTPLAFTPEQRNSSGDMSYNAVARLKPGVTVEMASAEMNQFARQMAQRYPNTHSRRGARAALLRENISGDLTYYYMLMISGAVAFVLLIACVNVANLQFARVSMRSREMSVRTALGAGRWRLIRQLLTENVLLGAMGSVFGVLVAFWGVDVLRSAMPAEVRIHLPGWGRLSVNGRALAFTLIVAVLSAVLAGMAPAFLSSRANVNMGLREGGRSSTSGGRRHRLTNLLVAGEMVLAIVLLVGAGLLVKGFQSMMEPMPGLDPDHALSFSVALPQSTRPDLAQVSDFQRDLLERVQALPQVESAAIVRNLPYSDASSGRSFSVQSRPAPLPGDSPGAQYQVASPGYFRAMHLTINAGRDFSESDGKDSPLVAVVSQRLAQRYFPGENPIGKQIKLGYHDSKNPWMTIVGVVSDIRHSPIDRVPRPTLYRPYTQIQQRGFDVFVRTAGDPLQLAGAVRQQVYAIDPAQPVFAMMTYERLLRNQMVGFRYVANMMAVFGLLALVLATVGIYSVMAYSVTERTHEIGLRMALGARQGHVLWMVVRRGLIVTIAGLAVGVPAAIAMARLLESIIFGVSATDFLAYSSVLLVLVSAAMLASYLPARRATRLDPMVTLRHE